MWGCHSHSRKWDLGVLWDFRKLRTWLQGSKQFALRCSLYRWKCLEVWMSKMASHEPFGHLQHKLWSKEGPGIKLAVWLPTTKSRNRPNPSMCKWSAIDHWKALKENYTFALDLVPIKAWGEKLWTPKILGVQTGIISGLHFGSPRKKCHSDASAAVRRREYYIGEGGGFPRVRAMVSQVSPGLPVACLSTKGVPECKPTNLLVGLM
jgi:hypothetical protein